MLTDSVLTKRHSKNIELVNYQYSGNQPDVIAGIGLINLLCYGIEKQIAIPIDDRIYNKDTDGKTKNPHFCDLLLLAKSRGITSEAVFMEVWDSSLKNLKAIRDHSWVWITCLRKNRKVNRDISFESLFIPEEELQVHLRGYGWVTVFKFIAKNGRIDYVTANRENPTQ